MDTRLDKLFQRWGVVGIALVAAALPWERFQLVPGTGFTLVKVGSTIAILAGIASWVRSRGASFPRTGLVPCIALFALAAAISLVRSYDPDATLGLLRVYATYTAFFLATATFVRSAEASFRLMHLFAFSAVSVGVLTILAASGMIWPVHWDTAFWAQQRLLEEFRDGQAMRVTAAGLDFNQASLYLLVGLAAVAFMPIASRSAAVARLLGAGVLIAAIALSMSRSGIAIACALVFAAVMLRTRGRYRIAAGAGLIVVAGAAALLASDFTAMLATRAQGGTVYAEGSAANRFEVYRIALALAPRFALTGAGLGASEPAMQASEFAPGAVMAIHNMPLLLLVELGALGLVAYGWLWWRVFRLGVVPYSHESEAQSTSWGRAFGGIAGAIFAMLLFQPLMVLPLYPFVLGLGFGPIAGAAARSLPRPVIATGLAAAAMVVTLLCVVENRWMFHDTVARTESFADALDAGLRAERAGHWQDAGSHYVRAGELGKNLSRAPYFDESTRLIDLGPLYAELGGGSESDPEAVALFAEGRTYLARGAYGDAETVLQYAWSIDPQFAYIRFHLAEAYWSSGMLGDSLRQYQEFRGVPGDNGGPADRIREAIASNANDRGLGGVLGRAARARRDGRWEDAVIAAEDALKLDSGCAEAHYVLGANAEVEDRPAADHYRAALDASPNHALAQLALERLAQTGNAGGDSAR